VQQLKEQIDQTRIEIERAQRVYDYNKAAELQYGRLNTLERQLAEIEEHMRTSGSAMLRQEVTEQDIAEIVSKWTGIPVSRLLEGEIEKLVHMEERLHRRVVGQDEAVSAVANAVRRARAGLQDPNRPLGSFLFLGPTGVGKTELARALAEFLFDDEQAMVRIDMSEYMEKHTVARLIGAPPGYVGYEEGGQLTEAVRRKPYSVVLFDEVEKAHHDVFNILLQILDDGRLTDGHGRVVNFKNTVIIMTSNIASPTIQELAQRGASQEIIRASVMEELRAQLRPEFLNRIDEIIVFRPLSRDQIGKIVDIQLNRLRKLLADRKITLELSPAAREKLVAEGYDPVFGARPLKRVIQQRIQNPLALHLLQGAFRDGDTILVDVASDGSFTFERVVVGEVVTP
jgi:ATP-dependent Clp protease ATP-binding subunit ClpB